MCGQTEIFAEVLVFCLAALFHIWFGIAEKVKMQ